MWAYHPVFKLWCEQQWTQKTHHQILQTAGRMVGSEYIFLPHNLIQLKLQGFFFLDLYFNDSSYENCCSLSFVNRAFTEILTGKKTVESQTSLVHHMKIPKLRTQLVRSFKCKIQYLANLLHPSLLWSILFFTL